jgi:hypothetical protein
MRFQDFCSRINLINIALVLVLVLNIRTLWVTRDEHDDDVLVLYLRLELHENNMGSIILNEIFSRAD